MVGYGKVRKLLIVGGTQVVIQGLAFLLGALLIRKLSIYEYSIYTICLSIIGSLTVLTDSGISSIAMGVFGSRIKDSGRLASALKTLLLFRTNISYLACIALFPISIYILIQNKVNVFESLVLTMLIGAVFYTALNSTFLEIFLRVTIPEGILQKKIFFYTLMRNLVIGLACIVYPKTIPILLISAIINISFGFSLNKEIKGIGVDIEKAKSEKELRVETWKNFKNIFPMSVFYSFSSQISILIVSFLGETSMIGEVSILGKSSLIFTFILSIFNYTIFPYFSKNLVLQDISEFVKKYIILQLLLFGLVLFGVLIFVLGDEIYFKILGVDSNYFAQFLTISIAVSGVAFINQVTNQVLNLNQIIVNPIYLIITLILGQALFIYFADLTKITQVIILGGVQPAVAYIYRNLYFFRKYSANELS